MSSRIRLFRISTFYSPQLGLRCDGVIPGLSKLVINLVLINALHTDYSMLSRTRFHENHQFFEHTKMDTQECGTMLLRARQFRGVDILSSDK